MSKEPIKQKDDSNHAEPVDVDYIDVSAESRNKELSGKDVQDEAGQGQDQSQSQDPDPGPGPGQSEVEARKAAGGKAWLWFVVMLLIIGVAAGYFVYDAYKDRLMTMYQSVMNGDMASISEAPAPNHGDYSDADANSDKNADKNAASSQTIHDDVNIGKDTGDDDDAKDAGNIGTAEGVKDKEAEDAKDEINAEDVTEDHKKGNMMDDAESEDKYAEKQMISSDQADAEETDVSADAAAASHPSLDIDADIDTNTNADAHAHATDPSIQSLKDDIELLKQDIQFLKATVIDLQEKIDRNTARISEGVLDQPERHDRDEGSLDYPQNNDHSNAQIDAKTMRRIQLYEQSENRISEDDFTAFLTEIDRENREKQQAESGLFSGLFDGLVTIERHDLTDRHFMELWEHPDRQLAYPLLLEKIKMLDHPEKDAMQEFLEIRMLKLSIFPKN
jgi:hypothetical protein